MSCVELNVTAVKLAETSASVEVDVCSTAAPVVEVAIDMSVVVPLASSLVFESVVCMVVADSEWLDDSSAVSFVELDVAGVKLVDMSASVELDVGSIASSVVEVGIDMVVSWLVDSMMFVVNGDRVESRLMVLIASSDTDLRENVDRRMMTLILLKKK
jgi:hypothetical protein